MKTQQIIQQMEKEQWYELKEFGGKYQISEKGQVKSVDSYTKGRWNNTKLSKGRLLKLSISEGVSPGYMRVSLSKNNKSKHYLIHRLVAKQFIDNPDNLPCINHKDSDRSNNNVSNLEWCTHKMNTQHALLNGRLKPRMGNTHPFAKLTSENAIKIRSEYIKGKNGYYRLGRKYGVCMDTVKALIRGETWKHTAEQRLKVKEILSNLK